MDYMLEEMIQKSSSNARILEQTFWDKLVFWLRGRNYGKKEKTKKNVK